MTVEDIDESLWYTGTPQVIQSIQHSTETTNMDFAEILLLLMPC